MGIFGRGNPTIPKEEFEAKLTHPSCPVDAITGGPGVSFTQDQFDKLTDQLKEVSRAFEASGNPTPPERKG